MKIEIVSIETDTMPLDGLLYEPDSGTAHHSALLMHGNMGNFYTGPARFLPPTLTAMGYACLAFNRRGHDILVSAVGREVQGGAFQTAREGREDNDRAAAFMAARGHASPLVIGHSNGGLLAACFAAEHPETAGLVLLSAHLGGLGVYESTCRSGLMAADQAAEFAERARSMVSDDRGDELLLMPGWWHTISATSLVDRMDLTPELLAQAPAIACPVLAVRGSEEAPDIYPAERFAAAARGTADVRIIDHADHWYTGHEDEVTRIVANWIAGTYEAQTSTPPD